MMLSKCHSLLQISRKRERIRKAARMFAHASHREIRNSRDYFERQNSGNGLRVLRVDRKRYRIGDGSSGGDDRRIVG